MLNKKELCYVIEFGKLNKSKNQTINRAVRTGNGKVTKIFCRTKTARQNEGINVLHLNGGQIFDVAAGKDVIELGDTTKLVWDVSPFATRLSLSNVEQPINRGQVSQTVAPSQSTTYEWWKFPA